MKKDSISLNFLQLEPKRFTTTFYYRLLDSIAEEDRSKFYVKYLQVGGGNVFKKYAIRFDPSTDFTKASFSTSENIDISKQFIFHHLRNELSSRGIETLDIKKDKYHRIYFPIDTHPEGIESVWLEPYYLQESDSFGVLLDFKFWVGDEYRKTMDSPVNKRVLQLSGTLDPRGNSNKAYYQFKYEKIKRFLAKYYDSINQISIEGLTFTISNTLKPISCSSLNPKVYQFENDAENSSPYFGLQKSHPFQLPDKQTNFLFIFKDFDRAIAINLLNGLKGKSSPNTFSGIETLFRIPFNNDCIRGKKVSDFEPSVLNSVVEEVQNERMTGQNLLPIFITNSRVTPADDKTYFLIKHTFTKNNIPCQVVTKDLINNSKTLNWSLSNIGLQIFAKAGGKPWKVKPAIKEGLIIGIGSKNKEVFVNENGVGKRKIEKYLMYSVLTDSSGLFKEIQILSETNNEPEYYASLVSKLKSIIQKSIEDGYKDIAIHTPFRISKEKVWDVIFKTVPSGINISIVLINDEHKFFAFDLSKNALVPYESTFIRLSEHEYLVWFEGLQYNNAPFSKPIGSPIYISFWYSNNFSLFTKDSYRRSLLQECINLSGANWRGFKAKQLPVSIFYCQKIADFLKKFEDYDLDHIEFENLKPWFL